MPENSKKNFTIRFIFILFLIVANLAVFNFSLANDTIVSKTPVKTQKNSKINPPNSFFYIEREGYILAYDTRNRNPHWVFEHLTSETLNGSANRSQFNFKEDEKIPKIFRATLKDYQSSGYDRGHMAPAANHKSCNKEMSDTFYLSNICPQIPAFNRGYWAKLEKYVRNLTTDFKDVYVISGALYLPYEDVDGKRYVKYEVFGKNNVGVPTHYFKVILMGNEQNITNTEAYILPNEDISSCVNLEKFKVSLKKVEQLSGIIF